MIERLIVVDKTRMPCPWWGNVPFCSSKTEWEFNPGLTIVWGPNGSGKSTLINTLARIMHCEQGGVSAITETSVGNLWKMFNKPPLYFTGVEVHSDGKAMRYVKPDKTVGVVGGSFDNDFFDEGLESVFQRRASSGQSTIARLNRLPRKGEAEAQPLNVEDKLGGINDIWAAAKKETTRILLEPRIPVGNTTLLLDEPELHLDLPMQAKLWREVVPRLTDTYQIIAATHSPWAANLPNATYLECVEGYLHRCRSMLQLLGITEPNPTEEK